MALPIPISPRFDPAAVGKTASSEPPYQIEREHMNGVGVVIPLEGPFERAVVAVDPAVAEIDVFVGSPDGHVPVPVILQPGGQSDLAVQGEVRGAVLAAVHRGGIVGGAEGPEPLRGEPVLGAQREVPGVVVIIMGKPPALPGDAQSLTFPE